MSQYKWKITRDHLGDDETPEGPWDCDNFVKHGETVKFRLYDDDGILYYSGILEGTFEGDEPLWDFGQPHAGCVRIDHLVNGKWEMVVG